MPRGKARFLGNSVGHLVDWQFSNPVRDKIKKLYPAKYSESDEERERMTLALERQEVTGDVPTRPEELFVAEIESEARWALFENDAADKASCKQDILAALTNLLNRSKSLKDDFRQLSPDVKRLFHVEMEPLEYADYLHGVCEDLEKVITIANQLPPKVLATTVNHQIAVELAIRVLRVAKEYKMDICATADPDNSYYSDAVKLLFYVGEAVGLSPVAITWWKTIIIEARKKVSDLKTS